MENQSNYKNLSIGEYKKFVAFLEDLHITHNEERISKAFIKEIQLLEEFSFLNQNKCFLVFDHIKFLPIYISDNVTSIIGYTPQELYNMTLLEVLQRLYWKQIPSLFKIHARGKAFRKLSKGASVKNQEVLFCGTKLKDKWGNLKTLLAKQKFLATDKIGEPTISFIVAEDITPIYKSNSSWIQIADFTKDIPLIRIYSDTANSSSHLLSNRELGILRLVLQKMDSSCIASHLNISVETVKKHRKNMLAKVGAKDMTGLIYICQQANVI